MPSGIYKRKPLTEKTRKKISKAHQGMKYSKKFKQNCKIRMLKEWQNPNSVYNSEKRKDRKSVV